MDETRARFLAAIAKQLPAERIAEAHLFAAIRQGGVESGVAVIALEQEQVAVELPQALAEGDVATEPAESQAADDVVDAVDVEETLGAADAEELTADADDDSPYASEIDVSRWPWPRQRRRAATWCARRAIGTPSRGPTAASGKSP